MQVLFKGGARVVRMTLVGACELRKVPWVRRSVEWSAVSQLWGGWRLPPKGIFCGACYSAARKRWGVKVEPGPFNSHCASLNAP
jgi:hypothetical protein